MGTYILVSSSSGNDQYISTETQLSLDILDTVSPWRQNQWKEQDDAAYARDQAEFEAASEEDKKTWWFGYEYPGSNRQPGLLNLEIFKKAKAEAPRTLKEYVEWAEKNMTKESFARMNFRAVADERFRQEDLDRVMKAIDRAVELNEDLYVS